MGIMFEKVLEFTFFWLPIAFVIGYFLELVYQQTKGKYRTAFNVFAFIGVFIHEAAHAILCLITGVPVKRVEVNYRNKMTGITSPNGAVEPKRPRKISFIQSFLIGIAPLLVGVIVFFFSLEITLDMPAKPLYRIIAGVICFSLLLGVRPSTVDLKNIKVSFQNNPSKSSFQVILLCFSFGLVWFLVDSFAIDFPFEFIYYIFMGVVFMTLKYLCVASYKVYSGVKKGRAKKRVGVLYGEFMEVDTLDIKKFPGE